MKLKLMLNNADKIDRTLLSRYNSKEVKGNKIICELPYYKNDEYVLPLFENGVLLIEASENGGATTNLGSCDIVCGLNGEKLRPYYIPRSGHLSNGEHAYFCYRKLIVIEVDRCKNIKIKCLYGRFNIDHLFAKMVIEEIWKGFHCELPERFSKFKDAIEAGIKKCNAYHCRSAYYYKTI